MFFPLGTLISTNNDSITSGSEKLYSGSTLYSKSFCKYKPTPPPGLVVLWLDKKLYPGRLTKSCVVSFNQVSDILRKVGAYLRPGILYRQACRVSSEC